MKKSLSYIIILTIILVACTNREKVFEYERSDYWISSSDDTTRLRQEFKVYSQGKDTLIYFTNYYTSGKLKSKVIMKNDLLWEIECVLDSLGNNKNFGSLKNGSGYVIEYTDDTGQPKQKGKYVNGNKEGWWKHYHFSGSIMDSTLFREGMDMSPPKNESTLTGLMQTIGPPIKNNYYR